MPPIGVWRKMHFEGIADSKLISELVQHVPRLCQSKDHQLDLLQCKFLAQCLVSDLNLNQSEREHPGQHICNNTQNKFI